MGDRKRSGSSASQAGTAICARRTLVTFSDCCLARLSRSLACTTHCLVFIRICQASRGLGISAELCTSVHEVGAGVHQRRVVHEPAGEELGTRHIACYKLHRTTPTGTTELEISLPRRRGKDILQHLRVFFVAGVSRADANDSLHGERHDEESLGHASRCELRLDGRRNLCGHVPRQNDDGQRLGRVVLCQHVVGLDGNGRAGTVPTLLEGRIVHDVLELVASRLQLPQEVQDHHPLGSGAVACDGVALLVKLLQLRVQPRAHMQRCRAEAHVEHVGGHPQIGLQIQALLQRWTAEPWRVRRGLHVRYEAGVAVHGRELELGDGQADFLAEHVEGVRGEERDVLVVDGVELAGLEHLALRRLDVESRRGAHDVHAGSQEVLHHRDVSKHVLRDDDVQLLGRRQGVLLAGAPEAHVGGVSALLGDAGEVLGWVHPVRLPTFRLEVVQLTPVVAADLQHVALGKLGLAHDLVRQPLEVARECPAGATLVQIVGEDARAVHKLGQLRVMRLAASHQLELVTLCGQGRLLRFAEVVRQRLLAQVKHGHLALLWSTHNAGLDLRHRLVRGQLSEGHGRPAISLRRVRRFPP
eukprot:scaffold4008_cov267-Pinguiococcus_pyrenoidosus.AAC.3